MQCEHVSTVSVGQGPPHRAGRLWARTATAPRARSALGSLPPHGVRREQSPRLAVNCAGLSPAQGPQKRPHGKLVSNLSVHVSQPAMGSECRFRVCKSELEPEMPPLCKLWATPPVRGARPGSSGPQCAPRAICDSRLLQPARSKCRFPGCTSELWDQNPAADPKDPLLGLALQGALRHVGGFEPLALGEWAGWCGLDQCLVQGTQ